MQYIYATMYRSFASIDAIDLLDVLIDTYIYAYIYAIELLYRLMHRLIKYSYCIDLLHRLTQYIYCINLSMHRSIELLHRLMASIDAVDIFHGSMQ